MNSKVIDNKGVTDGDRLREDSRFSEIEEEDMLVSQLNVDINNQYVVFNVGNENYGVPILAVQEIISLPEYTRIPGGPDYIPGIINLRGDVIPLYILKKKFGIESTGAVDNEVVIIIQIEGKRTVGLIVDLVSDVMSIDDEHIGKTPDFRGAIDVHLIEKIGRIGNKMVLILDLSRFFSDQEEKTLEKIMNSPETDGKD